MAGKSRKWEESIKEIFHLDTQNGDYEGPPIILYEYTSTRSGDHAKKFLEGF